MRHISTQEPSAIATVLRGSEPKRGTSPADPQDTTALKAEERACVATGTASAVNPGHETLSVPARKAGLGLLDVIATRIASVSLVASQEQTA